MELEIEMLADAGKPVLMISISWERLIEKLRDAGEIPADHTVACFKVVPEGLECTILAVNLLN